MSKLLVINEVADLLGVTNQTVYKLLKSGTLVGFKSAGLTSAWKISEEDVETYILYRSGRNPFLESLGTLLPDTEKLKQFLVLRYQDDLTFDMICSRLSISTVTAHDYDKKVLKVLRWSDIKNLGVRYTDIKNNRAALRLIARAYLGELFDGDS